jgi:hypothetical protein
VSNNNSKQIHYNKITSIIVGVHTLRIIGVVFLWGVVQGILHPAFGIPAGVGDILIGVTAIPVALFLKRDYNRTRHVIIIWNILGVADLIIAIILGRITSEMYGISTLTTIPWILIPTVVVPILLALHAIIFYRIYHLPKVR